MDYISSGVDNNPNSCIRALKLLRWKEPSWPQLVRNVYHDLLDFLIGSNSYSQHDEIKQSSLQEFLVTVRATSVKSMKSRWKLYLHVGESLKHDTYF